MPRISKFGYSWHSDVSKFVLYFMPELPEVETIKRGLGRTVLNKKIKKIWIDPGFKKKIAPSSKKLQQLLVNNSFKKIVRRAKLLVFQINDDLFLLIHLKLTGQLVYKPKAGKAVVGGHPIGKVGELPSKVTRVIFYFQDKSVLFFNDIRKFAFLKLVNKKTKDEELEKFGPEPLEKEFTFEKFEELLKRRPRMKIKPFLLDPKIVAGIGNIYSDEACFLAKVQPTRQNQTLKPAERKALFQAIKKILQQAVNLQGTSFSNYVGSDGLTGGFQNKLKVYGRGNQKCVRCKAKLTRIKMGSRSSVFCPQCQH